MPPFSVICESCRAQLRVRSRRLIGEIHACPKCSGMVLIQPPAGWSETAPPSPTKPRPVVAESVAPAVVSPTVYEVGDLSGIDLTTPANLAPPGVIPVAEVERWGRRVVWGSALGSVAIVTASLVWTLWPGSGERVAGGAQAPAITDPPVNIVAPPTDIAPVEAPAETVVNKPEISPDSPDAPEAAPAADVALLELPPAAESPAPPPEPAQENPAASVEAVVANDPPLPTVDPRDIDPENLDLILRRTPSGNSAAATAENSPDNEERSPLADPQSGDGSEEQTLAHLENALAAAAQQAAPETVRRGPTSAEDLQPVHIEQLLKLTIPEINVPKLPLHRAVAMLTQLTAIPITLDLAALRMAGVSVNREVSLRGQNVTAAELIRTTLAAAKLQYMQRGNQLIVVRSGADTVGKRNYQVADLLATDANDASEIAQLIQTLVAPQSWAGQGGTGQIAVERDQLAVTQSQQIHYDALILCERLRKARGLPLRSRYPAELLRTKPLETALAERLDRQTTFSFVTWTPLPEVIGHWQQRAGLTILVNWSALADVQLAPGSKIACAVEGDSWREALEAVLAPLGLAWVPVDEWTIQITSRAAAEATRSIEFYPLVKPRDGESLAAELHASLTDDSAVVFDPPSRSLLVRANAAGQWHVATQLSLQDDAR